MNNCILRFDEFSIEVFLLKDSEENLDSKIRQFPSKLHLVISISTLLALKGSYDYLFKEWYFGKKDSGFTVLLAVGT